MITLYVHHILGVRPDAEGLTLRPNLLEGLDQMEASVRVRKHRLDLSIRRSTAEEGRGGVLDGERVPWGENGIRLPLPTSDLATEIFY